MKTPEPTQDRDSNGRRLWKKWCSQCGSFTLTRFENIHKLCRSCGRAEGKGFPPGTLFDPEFAYLKKWSWHINNSGYVVHASKGELHRVVMGAKAGQEIHHKNHNKLDCRKENLKFTTHAANLKASWARKKQGYVGPPSS
jgi:hypothetical protein